MKIDQCVTDCKLEEFRKLMGLSASDLAKISHVSRQSIWRYERCLEFPSVVTANRLAASLGCCVQDIFPVVFCTFEK